MHRARFILWALAITAVFHASGLAQDASDLFLQAYQKYQAGERFEREARPQEALASYRKAGELLAKVLQTSPEWQPLVVEYRIKKTQESIARLTTIVAKLPPASTTLEGDLPIDEPTLPSVSSEPVGRSSNRPANSRPAYASPSTSADSVAGGDRELRRQIATLRRENDSLNEKLTQKTAEMQSALVEVDRTKALVVDLRSQLAQVTTRVEDMQSDGQSVGGVRKAYEAQLTEAVRRMTEAQADSEVLAEENDGLRDKLKRASTYITASDAIRENLLKERTGLAEAKQSAEAALARRKDNSVQVGKLEDENEALRKRVAEFEARSVTREEFEKLVSENKALNEQLAEARRGGAAREEVAKITAEKVQVELKLAEAETRLQAATAASSGGEDRDKMVLALQSELNTVNDRLLEAQSQTARGQDQIKDLQRQLDESTGELARLKINGSVGEQKQVAAENDLLRGIILRQLKEQTRRDASRKALEDEVARLQVKSDVIGRELAVLAGPVMQLTPEEQVLFKEPVALLTEPGSGSLEVSLAITDPSAPPVGGPESLPESSRELVQRAKELFQAKNYVEAEKIYQSIVEANPRNYFALSNLGAVQIEAGRLSAAEVALNKAIELQPNDSFAYTNLGIAFCRQGKFDEAINALRRSISLNSSDAVAHNYLGVCLGQREQWQDAELELKRSIEIKPEYSDAHFNLAVLYTSTQPPALELAKSHYTKATQLGAAPDESLERLIR